MNIRKLLDFLGTNRNNIFRNKEILFIKIKD